MIGTGTHHVVGDGIFVPDNMVAKSNNSEPAWFEQIEKYHNYPLFLSAPWPSSGLCVVGPVVQAARGAVEAARDHLLHYTKRSSPDEERLKMSAQLRLGEAASLAKAAELLTREVARVNWEELNWKDHEDDPRYHEVRGWMAEAVDLARKVVQILAQAGGTSIHYYSHRLGRHYRDVITGSSHVVCDFDDLTSGYGKSMLGLETRKRAHWKDINKVRNELAASRGLDYSKTDEESVKVMPTI